MGGDPEQFQEGCLGDLGAGEAGARHLPNSPQVCQHPLPEADGHSLKTDLEEGNMPLTIAF